MHDNYCNTVNAKKYRLSIILLFFKILYQKKKQKKKPEFRWYFAEARETDSL